MPLQDMQSMMFEFPDAVVYIGSQFSGATVCLADYLPVGYQVVTVVIERGVSVVFTDYVLRSLTIRFYCQPDSRVVYLIESPIQQSDTRTVLAWYVHEHSTVECVLIGTITMSECAIDIDLYLQGTGAHAAVSGVFVGDAQGCIKLITRQMHANKKSVSSVKIHTILGAHSLFEYRGLIDVASHASDTQASQVSKSILLADSARAQAMPMLQVRTNHVQCTHGAAIGNLDLEQIIYLQARGIGVDRARALLLSAFLMQALEGIFDATIVLARAPIDRMLRQIAFK
jgi:Fe-S cluster assembly scaffold protein SufB